MTAMSDIEARYPAAQDDGEKYIAECEYTCGWSCGPTIYGVAHAEAAKHDKDCFSGGPVVRNVKKPAPEWVNDPLMMMGGGF